MSEKGFIINKYYITNATFNNYIAIYFKVNKNIAVSEIFSDFLKHIDVEEKDLYSIYSTADIDQLLTHLKAVVYCNKNELDGNTIDNFGPAINRSYVFKTPPPAYHFDENCQFLLSDFYNLEIPSEIKFKGEKAVADFLKFADDNKKIFNEDPEKFKMLATTRFLLNNAFNDVVYPNSHIGILGLSLKSAILEATELTMDNKNIKNKKYASFKKGRCDQDEDVKEWFLKYKIPIYKSLEKEIDNFIGSDMYFNEDFLKSLRLRPCASCCKRI